MHQDQYMVETPVPGASWWQQAITAASGAVATILAQRLFRLGRRRKGTPEPSEMEQMRKQTKALEMYMREELAGIRGAVTGLDSRVSAVESRHAASGD